MDNYTTGSISNTSENITPICTNPRGKRQENIKVDSSKGAIFC